MKQDNKKNQRKPDLKAVLTPDDYYQYFVSMDELSQMCEVEESRIRQICRQNDFGFLIGTLRVISRELIPKIQDACLRSRKKLRKKKQKELQNIS